VTSGATSETRFPWLYFVLAFGITWLIWLPGLLATWGWIELPVPFIVFCFAGTWGRSWLLRSTRSPREGGEAAANRSDLPLPGYAN